MEVMFLLDPPPFTLINNGGGSGLGGGQLKGMSV